MRNSGHLKIPLTHEEARRKLSEILEKELTGEQEVEIKTEELQVEKEKEEIEVTPPPQREEIDLRSIRLRRDSRY